MLKLRPQLALLTAVSILAVGSVAQAQDEAPANAVVLSSSPDTSPPVVTSTPTPAVSQKPSRLIPPPPPADMPHPPVLTTTVDPAASNKPEVLPDPVSIDRITELAKLCQKVVPPSFEIKPELLWENGWAYRVRIPFRSGSMIGDRVEYSRPGTAETITLIDLGSTVICRVVVRIDAQGSVNEVRSSLQSSLPALPFADAPINKQYKQLVLANKNDEDHPNLLIAGEYSIDLTLQTTDLTGMNVVNADNVTMLMAEIFPLPSNLRPNP